jgi:hypothetical protein
MQKRVEVGRAYSSDEFLCIATFLPLRRWRDVIPFLRMSSRVERQLRETTGLARYSLRADFLHRRFWTLSVWADRAAVNAFVRSEPHATATSRFQDWAEEGAAFVQWTSPEGSINWKEAMERLKDPSFYHRQADQ